MDGCDKTKSKSQWFFFGSLIHNRYVAVDIHQNIYSYAYKLSKILNIYTFIIILFNNSSDLYNILDHCTTVGYDCDTSTTLNWI